MDSLFKTHWSGNDGHPSEDELLLFVDGELPARATGSLRIHLEACWSCRVRTEKIEEAISSFIDYRNQVLKPLVEQPPHGWRRFDGKLNGLAAEVGTPSVFSSVLGTLSRIFSAPQLSITWERSRFARMWDRARESGSFARIILKPATAVFVVAVLAVTLIYLNRTPVVSATEILQRANNAQEQQIQATKQAVVYQKVQVRRKVASSYAGEALTWEVWSDTANVRVRQSVDISGNRQFVEDVTHSRALSGNRSATPPPTLLQLDKLLRANHMNPATPLSAASYDNWRRSVEPKHEEVTKNTLADGREALTLHTTPTGQISVGGIAEALLVVRASDWHPVEERLRVRGEQGDEEFELTETAYSVVSLTALSPEIFAEPVASPSPARSPEIAKTATRPVPAANPQPPPPVATTALEIEVLHLLNQVGADVTEQINVTRTADGLLQVQGIVETDKRKDEIIQALQTVATNPALKIDIQTVAEASRREAQQKKSTYAPPVVSRVEVSKGAMPVEADLRRYFSASGGDVDEKVRQFASRMINHSQQALFHASALKRLGERFSDEQLRAFDPDVHAKWLAIIRQHARAFQEETASLRQELRPVFFPSMPLGQSQVGSKVRTDTELIAASVRLMELAATNDQIVRSAFTISAETSAISAVATPQFWKSLSNAENLAAKIAKSE